MQRIDIKREISMKEDDLQCMPHDLFMTANRQEKRTSVKQKIFVYAACTV